MTLLLAVREADLLDVMCRMAWCTLTANWDLEIFGETIH